MSFYIFVYLCLHYSILSFHLKKWYNYIMMFPLSFSFLISSILLLWFPCESRHSFLSNETQTYHRTMRETYPKTSSFRFISSNLAFYICYENTHLFLNIENITVDNILLSFSYLICFILIFCISYEIKHSF